jgi:hypothetical protein
MDGPDRIQGITPAPPAWRVAERERERPRDDRERRPKHDDGPPQDDGSGEGGLIDVRA